MKPRSFLEEASLRQTCERPNSGMSGLALLRRVDANGELERQARYARFLGSPLVAGVLGAARRQLWRGRQTAALVARWSGDPAQTALALRLNGALHALARQGRHADLTALYQGQHDDFDRAVGDAIAADDQFIAEWMQGPTQTNEVARTAAIHAALMVLADRFAMPFELLELGASCGLNLNLARYAYRLGSLRAGAVLSPVEIAPQWHGPEPAPASVEIASARGVDLNPLDPTDLATRERLLSYVWADQPQRIARLEKALILARTFAPQVDRGTASIWLADQLARSQQSGQCRVVLHSMVMQYLMEGDRAQVHAAMRRAGSYANHERPLACIGFEWTADRQEVHLTLHSWPDGEQKCLAICHPYGEWIEWIG